METWQVCRPVVANSHFWWGAVSAQGEKSDPDPHQHEQMDPDPGIKWCGSATRVCQRLKGNRKQQQRSAKGQSVKILENCEKFCCFAQSLKILFLGSSDKLFYFIVGYSPGAASEKWLYWTSEWPQCRNGSLKNSLCKNVSRAVTDFFKHEAVQFFRLRINLIKIT